MGGGRNSPKDANQSAQAASASEAASAALSQENLHEQTQNYNYLFGKDGTSGSLTPFMDPNSLKATEPTGAYKAGYQKSTNTLNQAYNQQRGSLAQAWANNGSASGTPSGFQSDQMRKLSRDQADSQGGLFATTVGQQYQDALNNFWNANNIASGQAASARSGALEGAQNQGQTATGIYGTAGQYHQGAGATILGSALQAGGQVGAAAACPARGSKIRTAMGDKLVELLDKGDSILQSHGGYYKLRKTPVSVRQECVACRTEHVRSTVSRSHCWQLPKGGYVIAPESSDTEVRTMFGREYILSIEDAGDHEVFIIPNGGNNTYLCDGIWSLM